MKPLSPLEILYRIVGIELFDSKIKREVLRYSSVDGSWSKLNGFSSIFLCTLLEVIQQNLCRWSVRLRWRVMNLQLYYLCVWLKTSLRIGSG